MVHIGHSDNSLCGSPFRLCIGVLSQDCYQRSPRVYGLRVLELVEEQVVDHHRNVSGRKRDTSAEGETQVVGRAQSFLATHVYSVAESES